MIYKRFKDTELFEGSTNKTYEYHIEDNDINYCIVVINGRFPLQGSLTNTVCKEMVHILEGEGIIVVENKKYDLKKDDVVLIKPNEKYYWEGNMRVGASCSPAWYPEQSHNVE
jgi:mannose-6-phosphate isomerase-like protein (cupin superfamily)